MTYIPNIIAERNSIAGHRFPIGTKYLIHRGKREDICTVVDQWTLKCKRCGEVKDLYNVPLLNLEKIKVGPGRPYKLFTCNTCGKVMGSAEVRKHKCQK